MKASIGKKASVLVFLLLFGLAGSSPSYGQDGKYTFYELGTLGGSQSKAYDINDAGQVVGESETTTLQGESQVWQAFIGTKDGISHLFPNEAVRSSANAINRDGTITGNKNGRGFMVGGGSPFVDLGVLPGAGQSLGLSINSGKKVVGFSWNEGVWEKGALWEAGSGNEIGTLGGLYTRATSVNDADEVVGYSQTAEGSRRAFHKAAGNTLLNDLGVLGVDTDSSAFRINNRGLVAGYSLKYDENWVPTARACLWGDTGIQELKKKNAAGLSASVSYSEAYGINDAGFVVGTYWSGDAQDFRAFIWDPVNEMRDLNSLLPDNSGMILTAANAINNNGEIVGYGYKAGDTKAIAFLLVPPPGENPSEEPFEVDIDLRPWSSNNKIDLHARWTLIPIAILADADFNALKEVDRQSLTFGRTGDEDSLAFCMPWKWDVNHDRKKDLVCYFYERPMGFRCGDAVGTLKGKTLKGEEFWAQEKIQVGGCPPPPRKRHWGR